MKTIEQITQADRQAPAESFDPIDPVGAAVSPVYDETFIDRWLLCCNRNIPAAELFGRAVLWAVLVVWGLVMITGPIEKGWCTFLHNIDLPIHETGHLIFLLFGRFAHFLGGSIFQILLPAIFSAAFLICKRDAFAAAVMFWWIGQNFLDVASYINDARAMSANLVGGNIHDWNWLLAHMGRLHQDRQIAAAVFAMGAVIMILSIIWSGWILWLQTDSRIKRKKQALTGN
jgi:hypothetical protein